MLGGFLLLLSSLSYSYYSEEFDKELLQLIVTNPEEALVQLNSDLSQVNITDDIEKQLSIIYYLTEAHEILANFDEVEKHNKQGLLLAEENHNIKFRSMFLGSIAYQYDRKGKFKEAISIANQAMEFAREVGDDRLIADNYYLQSYVQLSIDDYGEAIKSIEIALGFYSQNSDKINISLSYNLLAIIYDSLSDYENAIKYYKESEAFDELKSPYNQASQYFNLASVYVAMEEYENALAYYQKSKKISESSGDDYSLAYVSVGMSELLVLQDKVDEAETILQPVIDILDKLNDEVMLFNALLVMAEIKTINKQFPKALKYLDDAKVIVSELSTPSTQILYLQYKSYYFEELEQWQDAFTIEKKIGELREESFIKDKEKSMDELKVKFNAKFDQEKYQLLKKQSLLQQNSLDSEKVKQKYLWGLVVLGAILFGITYMAYRGQKKVKKHLFKLSITDHLTQVANRRYIIRQLKKLHQYCLEEDHKYSLVMIDLDDFKQINDKYGHDVGNDVLVYFAKTVSEIIAENGEIGRIGGEEWLILFPKLSPEQIHKVLEKIRETYKNTINLPILDGCELSFSSGVITYTGQHDTYERILSEVDKAMYEAKANGKEQDIYI